VKVNGRRAHELVREGVDVVLPERPVTVFTLDVDDIRLPGPDQPWAEADIRVHCSSGTYIRSIARDVGEDLGVGGHLVALRRTSAGPFTSAQARTLDELGEEVTATGRPPALSLTLDEAMASCFPVRSITEAEGEDLATGKWLDPVGEEGVVAAVTPAGRAVALLEEKEKRAASVFVARPAGMA
jgi:tRNA pseudouridine55 synthase